MFRSLTPYSGIPALPVAFLSISLESAYYPR